MKDLQLVGNLEFFQKPNNALGPGLLKPGWSVSLRHLVMMGQRLPVELDLRLLFNRHGCEIIQKKKRVELNIYWLGIKFTGKKSKIMKEN